jgi:sRNA-binding carbon storage regulator CsrA
MLVIAREPEEWLDLILPDGREIGVMYIQKRGASGQIAIGIEAPADVKILRREINAGKNVREKVNAK